MLRTAMLLSGLAMGTTGCLWEPIQPLPIQGNDDAAPVIVSISPNSNLLFLSSFQGDSCVAYVQLLSVYSPHGAPLQASFFLNFDAQTNSQPLSIDGQTQFNLQPSQPDSHFLSLNQQQIRIDDFSSQFSGHTNVLQVFVSDDLVDCPNPSTAPTTSTQSQICNTTSWVWVIEPFGCPAIQNF